MACFAALIELNYGNTLWWAWLFWQSIYDNDGISGLALMRYFRGVD
jgi:hypothetical protein